MTKPSSPHDAGVKTKRPPLAKSFKVQCRLGKSVPKHATVHRLQDKKEKTPENVPSFSDSGPKVEVHFLLHVPSKQPTNIAIPSTVMDHFETIQAKLNQTQAKCNCTQKFQEQFHKTSKLKLYMLTSCGNDCPCQDVVEFMDNKHPPIVASISH
uniref:TAZ-type domain-containing protein n=1 Tax=Panagrellus redivivus TaxID=6233 RepID=A0A7E4VE69_PANRE